MSIESIRIYNRVGQHRVFGLVGFEVIFNQGASLPEALMFAAGPHAQTIRVQELADLRKDTHRAHNQLVVHLNTFLLENGPVTIEMYPCDSSGQNKGGRLAAYEVVVDNRGMLYEKVRKELLKLGRPTFLPALLDSTFFGNHEVPDLLPWFERKQSKKRASLLKIFGRVSRQSSVRVVKTDPAANIEEAISNMESDGYCVLPEKIPAELCDQLVSEAKAYIEREGKIQGYEWGSSQRVMNTHQLPAGKQVWLFPPVIQFLQRWFADDPVACQTLFYFFGSQQSAHQDTIHLTPYPAGYMCGVWVALEDVQPGSGELFVYPRTHKLKRLRGSELGLQKVATNYSQFEKFDAAVEGLTKSDSFERVLYYAKKGTILVWHENLIHGGSKRQSPNLSRHSIVSHYFARGSLAYYDARGEAATLAEVVGPASG